MAETVIDQMTGFIPTTSNHLEPLNFFDFVSEEILGLDFVILIQNK